jgi:hypothetical protein
MSVLSFMRRNTNLERSPATAFAFRSVRHLSLTFKGGASTSDLLNSLFLRLGNTVGRPHPSPDNAAKAHLNLLVYLTVSDQSSRPDAG